MTNPLRGVSPRYRRTVDPIARVTNEAEVNLAEALLLIEVVLRGVPDLRRLGPLLHAARAESLGNEEGRLLVADPDQMISGIKPGMP